MYSLPWQEFPPCYVNSFTMNAHINGSQIFKRKPKRSFLTDIMYLCMSDFAATEYVDEQPDGCLTQNVLFKYSGSVS